MAKSARSSTRKANNQRLKSKVFGPIEAARAERLSARLLELAAQPKPPKPESDEVINDDAAEIEAQLGGDAAAGSAMDVDPAKPTSTKRSDKKRIEKRKTKSKIVFPKYGDKKKTKKR